MKEMEIWRGRICRETERSIEPIDDGCGEKDRERRIKEKRREEKKRPIYAGRPKNEE